MLFMTKPAAFENNFYKKMIYQNYLIQYNGIMSSLSNF